MRKLTIKSNNNVLCPICHRRVGQIDRANYYCQECCVQINVRPNRVTVYKVGWDGELRQKKDV